MAVDPSPPYADELQTRLNVASDARRWPVLVWATLAALLLLVAAARYRFLESPLERDEGEFAYGGQLLLEGELPYVAFYAMKLPGIYAVYALFEAAFGQTIWGIHLGLLLVNLASIALIYLLGGRLFDRGVGLFAAAAFALLTFSPAVTGTQAQAEHFVLLPALVGAYLLLVARDRRSLLFLSLSGLAFGLAIVIKQHGAVYPLFGAAYLVLREPQTWLRQPGRRLADLAAFTVSAAVPLIITCVIFAAFGAWEPFVFWTFTYARDYAVELPLADGWDNLAGEGRHQLRWCMPLWIGAAIGALLVVIGRAGSHRALFLVLWTAASCLAIVPGLYFRPHYFLFLSPSIALLAAVAWRQIADECTDRGTWGRAIPVVGVVLLLALPAAQLAWFYFPLDPDELPTKLYGDTFFAESPRIARELADRTAPGDRLAVLGSEPQILFYSRRRSATGHIYMYPLMELHPFARQMQEKLIEEIEQARPQYLVYCSDEFSWARDTRSTTLVLEWLERFLSTQYYEVARLEARGPAPSEYITDSVALRTPPRSDRWIGIYHRRAGHE